MTMLDITVSDGWVRAACSRCATQWSMSDQESLTATDVRVVVEHPCTRTTLGTVAIRVKQDDLVDRVQPRDAVARAIDTQARAYGWEVGRGRPLAGQVDASDDNPFLDQNWRAKIENDR
jgi:hypothetical protein